MCTCCLYNMHNTNVSNGAVHVYVHVHVHIGVTLEYWRKVHKFTSTLYVVSCKTCHTCLV